MPTSGSKRRSAVGLVVALVTGAAGTAMGQAPPEVSTDTIVLLPDTQYYSVYDLNTFLAQTQWIAGQPVDLIKMVIHLGDITNDNTDSQWGTAVQGMAPLNAAGVPYVMVPGNHDNPGNGTGRDTNRFNAHFPKSGFENQLRHEWHTLDPASNKSDNSYATFRVANRDFMVVNLEFAPRKQVLCQAHDAIAAHPNHTVIIATHCYQAANGRLGDCTRSYGLIGANGRTIWEEVARRNPNVQMIVSGHVTSSALTRHNRVTDNQLKVGSLDSVPDSDVVEILT